MISRHDLDPDLKSPLAPDAHGVSLAMAAWGTFSDKRTKTR